jgi:hypothetical protein
MLGLVHERGILTVYPVTIDQSDQLPFISLHNRLSIPFIESSANVISFDGLHEGESIVFLVVSSEGTITRFRLLVSSITSRREKSIPCGSDKVKQCIVNKNPLSSSFSWMIYRMQDGQVFHWDRKNIPRKVFQESCQEISVDWERGLALGITQSGGESTIVCCGIFATKFQNGIPMSIGYTNASEIRLVLNEENFKTHLFITDKNQDTVKYKLEKISSSSLPIQLNKRKISSSFLDFDF